MAAAGDNDRARGYSVHGLPSYLKGLPEHLKTAKFDYAEERHCPKIDTDKLNYLLAQSQDISLVGSMYEIRRQNGTVHLLPPSLLRALTADEVDDLYSLVKAYVEGDEDELEEAIEDIQRHFGDTMGSTLDEVTRNFTDMLIEKYVTHSLVKFFLLSPEGRHNKQITNRFSDIPAMMDQIARISYQERDADDGNYEKIQEAANDIRTSLDDIEEIPEDQLFWILTTLADQLTSIHEGGRRKKTKGRKSSKTGKKKGKGKGARKSSSKGRKSKGKGKGKRRSSSTRRRRFQRR